LIISMITFVVYVICRLALEHELNDPFLILRAFDGQFSGIFEPGSFRRLWPLIVLLELTVIVGVFWAWLNVRIEMAIRQRSRWATIVRWVVPRFAALFGDENKSAEGALDDMHLYTSFAGVIGVVVTVIQVLRGWSFLNLSMLLQALLGLYIWCSNILYGWEALARFVRRGMTFQ